MPICILSTTLTLVTIQRINEQKQKCHLVSPTSDDDHTCELSERDKIFQPIDNVDKNICRQLIWFLKRQWRKFVSL